MDYRGPSWLAWWIEESDPQWHWFHRVVRIKCDNTPRPPADILENFRYLEAVEVTGANVRQPNNAFRTIALPAVKPVTQ